MPSFEFPKKEKLKHKRLFELLFEKGESKYKYPVRMLWIPLDRPVNSVPFLVGVSVPKRNFSKAVQRNKLKRKLREAYRRHKSIWSTVTFPHSQYAVLFIYTAKQFETYHKIEKTICYLMNYFLEMNSEKSV